jgi:hypothetical protein
MKRHLFTILGALVWSWAACAGDASPAALDASAAFARLKTLAGEWEAASGGMGKTRVTYEVIAGGSALVERETGANMPPMVTVYHLDGNRLLLTHYCAAGNQPRMQAAAYDPAAGELRFRFLDVTNLASPGAGHMRNVTFRFAANDRLRAEWDFYENGKLKSTENAQYTRVR